MDLTTDEKRNEEVRSCDVIRWSS